MNGYTNMTEAMGIQPSVVVSYTHLNLADGRDTCRHN